MRGQGRGRTGISLGRGRFDPDPIHSDMIPSGYKLKVRRAFAIQMGWWVYNDAMKWWKLVPNLQ